MSKRKLYPISFWDRVLFWTGSLMITLGWPMAAWLYYRRGYLKIEDWFIGIILGPCILLATYIMQDRPAEGAQEQYSVVIADIESIGKQLTSLAAFLKSERAKVEESEITLRRLREEKTQLEPVVTTHRETVNAILAAHAKTTASRAWKERALGFIGGILASVLASMIFEFLRR